MASVWTPLAIEDLEAVAAACQAEEVEAIAICFLHAYAHPEHEEPAAAFLRERLPGVPVTASSEITREWREFERSSTAVLNAYVQPILDGYLADLEQRLRAEGLTGAALRHALQRRRPPPSPPRARRRSPWSNRGRSPASPARP